MMNRVRADCLAMAAWWMAKSLVKHQHASVSQAVVQRTSPNILDATVLTAHQHDMCKVW